MKSGMTLNNLAAELTRQSQSKRDFICDTRRLQFRPADGEGDQSQGVVLEGVNGGMRLRPTAHAQMAETLGIPKAYYDRLLAQAPDLLARNANHWLTTQPARKMIRTLDGEVRAVLSDGYRPLDNMDLAEAVLPKLLQLEARVESSQVTENRMYLKAVTPRIQEVVGKIKPGVHQFLKPGDDDLIQAGIVVSNSEVGLGSLAVTAMDYRLACYNGLIREHVVKKTHVGRVNRQADALEEAREYFRTETRVADDRAFFMKVQDAVGAAFDAVKFRDRVQQYRAASERPITSQDVAAVVEVTAKRFTLTEGEKAGVLTHLIQGGDLSQWGLVNAITRTAHDVESYDRSVELEALGGVVIELPKNSWQSIAEAKAVTTAA